MHKIIKKEQLSDKVYKIVVYAPEIAKARRPGHFVIVRVGENGERIPLTIAKADVQKGTITLIIQKVGVSSFKLVSLNEGDNITDIVGPLGRPTNIKYVGTVVCAGGGVGIAPMLPIVEGLKKAGNKVISVLAGRSKDLIILENEIRAYSDEVVIMTDDGSYGKKGLVTQGIEKVILEHDIAKCYAIGPAIMMKFVCLLTKKYDIPTEVSLNTIMVDGTGMCGACRITVDKEIKFVCVDGPEFDGHKVDFDEMLLRLKAYKPEEELAYARLLEENPRVNKQEMSDDDVVKSVLETEGKLPSFGDLSPKERANIARVPMPQLDPKVRANSLTEEVNIGYSMEMAITEAQRCLNCKNAGCIKGCPVNINIPEFIHQIAKGNPHEAAHIISESSSLPAICGRVCPQEKQCESGCIYLKMKKTSVAIGNLERFAADYSRNHPQDTPAASTKGNGIKVAVIGSGPAGLSFASEMAKFGYDVTVFEALHKIGGVLQYGIPEYRLPKAIVQFEINKLKEQGVTFVTDCIIGNTLSLADLKEQDYKGYFVGAGAGLPKFMDIPGENLINVLSANEYLTRVNLMKAEDKDSDTPLPQGKKVLVVGGGNTAMDAVRTALRLSPEHHATLVYRRSEEEMPARKEEVLHAKEEGVQFLTLHTPIKYEADENGRVKAAYLQKMQLGESDVSGRRRPIPIEGEIIKVPVDLVIVAIGVSPNPIFTHSVEHLDLTNRNTIVVDEHQLTSLDDLYAGGDIVRGGATVILAMGDGKKAAQAMHERMKCQYVE